MFGQGAVFEFRRDILESYIFEPRKVAPLHVERDGGIVHEITVFKTNARVFVARRFQPDFQRSAPIAPQGAVLHRNIRNVAFEPFRRFQTDGIIETAHETVFDAHAAAVHQIDAVGVVTPLPHDFDVVDDNILAFVHGKAPVRRIAQDNALHRYVFAVVKADVALRVILVAVRRDAHLVTVVQHAAAVDLHVLGAVRQNRTVNERAVIQKHAVPALHADNPGEMQPRAEIQRGVFLFVSARRIHEDVQRAVPAVGFEDIRPRPAQRKFRLVAARFHGNVFFQRADDGGRTQRLFHAR